MKNILVVFFFVLSGVAANKEVHLVPAHIICPKVTKDHDILLPDPNDCSIYYKCEHGFAAPQSCPRGLLWCRVLKECTLPALAKCAIGNTVVTYSPGELATYKPKPQEPSETDNICPYDNILLPDELNCELYYRCVNGIPTSEKCPKGMSYSCWIGACEDAALANCLNSGSQENKTCAVNGEKLPHPEDCHKYYECEKNTVKAKRCSDNLEFNQWFMECYSPKKAHCQMHGVTTPTTTTTGSTITPSPTEPICPKPGATLPSHTDCSSYYECDANHKPVLRHCTDNLKYSSWDKECEASVVAECINDIKVGESCKNNGQKMPDSQNCDKYYECTNKTIEEKTCEKDMQYNQWFEKCDSTELAHCSIYPTTTTSTTSTVTTPSPSPDENICPIEGAKIPNELDCHSYFVCNNDTAIPHNCPDNLEYSCWDQECLPAQSANCINAGNQTGQACNTNEDKMPNPEDCTSYYECVDGTVVKKFCEPGLSYNKYYKKCLVAALAHCKDISTTEPSERTTLSTPGSSRSTSSEPGTLPESESTSESNTPSNPTNTSPSHSEPPGTGPPPTGTDTQPPGTGTLTPGTDTRPTSESTSEPSTPPNSSPSNPTNTEPSTPSHSQPPGTGTSPPGTDTQPPGTGTLPPGTSTLPPVTDTRPPSESTSEPSAPPNSSPSNPTNTEPSTPSHSQPPEIGTSPPGTDTQPPGTGTSPPGTGTQPPGTSTLPSGIDTQTPSESTSEPSTPPNSSPSNPTNTEPSTPSHSQPPGTGTSPPGTDTQPPGTGTQPISSPSPTISVSPGPDDICPIPGAKLPDEIDCHAYYVCENGEPKSYKCPFNLEYSCWDQVCLPPDLATCANEGGQVGQACSNEGEQLPNPADCNSYHKCINGTVEIQVCASGTAYNKWFKNCVQFDWSHCNKYSTITPRTTTPPIGTTTEEPSLIYDICPIPNATLPNEVDCTSYYRCIGNTPTLEYCPDNYGYSCWDQKCLPASEANCILVGTQEDKECSHDGQKMPDIEHCGKYYECHNGKTKSKKCAFGQEYGKWYGKCVFFLFSHCSTHATKVPTIEPSSTLPTPTPGPIETCKVNGELLPNPTNCSTYFECVNNKPEIRSCAGGLEYSCWNQTCLPPSEANCIAQGSQIGKKCKYNGQRLQNPEDCQTYYECNKNKEVELKKCFLNWYYIKWFGICTPIKLFAHCQTVTTMTPPTTSPTLAPTSGEDICPIVNALLPNPLKCNAYYKCENNSAVSYDCPDGQAYSCWDQMCLPLSESHCIANETQVGLNCSKEGERLKNVKNCGSYFECMKGIVQIQYCFVHLQYNQWYGKCVASNVAHCETSITPTVAPSTPPTPTTNETCKENEVFPNAANCSTYFKCVNNKSEIQSCAAGLEFSCWDKICLPPSEANCINQGSQIGKKCKYNSQRLQNPDDCQTYYECKDHKVELKKCFLNWYFSNWLGICTPIKQLAHCQTDTTPPPNTSTPPPVSGDDICPIPDALLPNPLKCNAYYKCENNSAVPYDCPDGQDYSCWDQMCLPLSESHCIANQTQVGMTCSTEGTRLQNVEDCASYYECVNGKVLLKHCFIGLQFNRWYRKCYPSNVAHCETSPVVSPTATPSTSPTPSSNETCKENEVLPNPANCSTYFKCVNNKSEIQSCAAGLEFSYWDKTCLPPSEANCRGSQIGKKCKYNGQRLQNPDDCQTYYECKDHKVELKKCFLNWYFINWLGICTPIKQLAHCQTVTTITPPTTSTPSVIPPVTTTPTTCTDSSKKLADVKNCKGYYECENGKYIRKTCPNELTWNCYKQACSNTCFKPCCSSDPNPSSCISSDSCILLGSKIPNPIACDKYFECSGFKIKDRTCPEGQTFNWIKSKCVKDSIGQCVPNLDNNTTAEQPSSTSTVSTTYSTTIGDSTTTGSTKPSIVYTTSTPSTSTKQTTSTTSTTSEKTTSTTSTTSQKPTSTTSTTSEKSTTSSSTTTRKPNPLCPVTTQTIRYPDPANCFGYFECVKGQLVKMQCPPDQVYNCKLKACEHQDVIHCCSAPTTTTAKPFPNPIPIF